MDFVEYNDLDQLASKLNHLEIGTYYLSVKMDAFVSSFGQKRIARSRKSAKHDEVLPSSESPYFKSGLLDAGADETPSGEESAGAVGSTVLGDRRRRSASFGVHSYRRPPQRRRTSSLGDLSEPSSKALFMDMIQALNSAFPDYDFADSKLSQFTDVDISTCVQQINTYLAEVTLHHPMILEQLWSVLDEMVNLRGCEAFSFSPADSDRDDEFIWCFHYFIFNSSIRRLLYFSCGAKSLLRKRGNLYSSDEEGEEEMDADESFDLAPTPAATGYESEEEGTPCDAVDDEQADDSEGDLPDWDGII